MKKILVWSIMAILVIGCDSKPETNQMHTLFVGTYTDGDSEGIYKLTFDSNTGILSEPKLSAVLPNPSFLVISDDKKQLYSIQETKDFNGVNGGITSFSLNDGELSHLNTVDVGGAHPCHVTLSGNSQLAAANYTGGSVSIFDLNADGSLKPDPQIIDHKVLDTAKVAHAHKVHFNKDGLFASDLGLDAVKKYVQKDSSWIPAHQASLDLPDGAGPRHFEFNLDRSFLYVINELNATIAVLKRDDEGSYNPIQTENTVAPDWEGVKSCADIHLSPDGKFLYGSNRGENTIVIFAVDQSTGKISLIGRESVRGDWPRNFTIDPTGNFVLVANQKSNSITTFKRGIENGTMEFLSETKLSSPVCLVFLEETE
ncbi:MAG: lactonase family protein [Flavobacteriaceae bacterium]